MGSEVRECLKCGGKFKSVGAGNRVCKGCNVSNRGVRDDYCEVGGGYVSGRTYGLTGV